MYNVQNDNGAYLSVLAGAGGDDAKDWAEMLTKMYIRYSERKGWKALFVDDRTIQINGSGVYTALKAESGVHRLVRISPFDSKKLRHTSFALVDVLPILPMPELSSVKIPDKDLKVDFMRSSGPGGQNVNKVETAVRIVHLPTGIVASCRVERSQSANRERALAILKTQLITLMREKHETEIENLKTKVKPEWGNEIRSYVLHPYKQVKDHRTGKKISKVEEVLLGDLDQVLKDLNV